MAPSSALRSPAGVGETGTGAAGTGGAGGSAAALTAMGESEPLASCSLLPTVDAAAHVTRKRLSKRACVSS
jgi:hypothetical protein